MKSNSVWSLGAGAILAISVWTSPALAQDKAFPAHWGAPPAVQTRDIRPLPGGYGSGSSTLANWIQKNLDADARRSGAGPAGEWTSLFDGKTLMGFEVKGGYATYAVEDGTIVGTTAEGSGNTFLCTKKEYGDFELEFEVKVDSRLNSGMQVRSKLRNPEGKYGGTVYGPQIEIEAGGEKGGEAGFIYGEGTRRGWLTPKDKLKPHGHFKDGEWNQFRVVAKGARIQTWINGSEIEDLSDLPIYEEHKSGLIGLQVHGIGKGQGPYRVAWRNLRIREL